MKADFTVVAGLIALIAIGFVAIEYAHFMH